MLKHLTLVAGSMLFIGNAVAAPATSNGFGALALAALVAENEPALGPHWRYGMRILFEGGNPVSFPPGSKIMVRADKIDCRASNVAISQRSCVLTFGAHVGRLKGRRANELLATMLEAGVAGDAGAGSVFESLTKLVCTIDPSEVKQNAGGGASCAFQAGP